MTTVRGQLGRDELASLVERGEIDTVLTVFPDMYGRLVGKRITGHFFLEEVLDHGMHVCDYLLACDMDMDPVPGYALTSWEDGYGDLHAVPEPGTLRRAAWLEKTALIVCDLRDEESGEPVSVAPRTVLRRQVELALAEGLRPKAGSELEFFILSDSYDECAAKNFEGLETMGWYVEDYHILKGTREEPLVGAIRRAMDASGVPVEFSKGEWGPGQHEINLRYTDTLEMADRHVIYKNAAKEIAYAQGMAVTFMAKFDQRLAGNSMHLHSSLWSEDGERPLFAGEGERLAGTGMVLSDLFRWYLGGLVEHARECALLFAPYVNSYKRFAAGTFAPTRIAWSHDNRPAGFRVLGAGSAQRVECRIPGGDANPYMVMAAILASGLDGVARRTEPPPIFSGNAYKASELPSVPATVEEALELFRNSTFLRSALGEEVVTHYAHFAETEIEKFRASVTGWERRRYLERG